MGANPVHHGSQVQERCHVDQRLGSIVLDWAEGRICGIIYKDGPGERQTDRGLAWRLDDPASLVVSRIPGLAQHLYHLARQGMVGADDAYMSHILCLIGGLLLRTSQDYWSI